MKNKNSTKIDNYNKNSKIRSIILLATLIIILSVIILTLYKINRNPYVEDTTAKKTDKTKVEQNIQKTQEEAKKSEEDKKDTETERIKMLLGENKATEENLTLSIQSNSEPAKKENYSEEQKSKEQLAANYDNENKYDETETGKSYSMMKSETKDKKTYNKCLSTEVKYRKQNILENENKTSTKKLPQKKTISIIKYDKDVKDINDSEIMIVDKTSTKTKRTNEIKPKVKLDIKGKIEIDTDELQDISEENMKGEYEFNLSMDDSKLNTYKNKKYHYEDEENNKINYEDF